MCVIELVLVLMHSCCSPFVLILFPFISVVFYTLFLGFFNGESTVAFVMIGWLFDTWMVFRVINDGDQEH